MYVDNFKNGESEKIHSYKLEAQIEAKSPLAAVQKYFADVLYFSFDIDKAGTEEADCIHYSNLVDDDNSEANAKDIELWKEGKVNLVKTILEHCTNKEDLAKREEFWLKKFDVESNPMFMNRTNKAFGNSGLTEETKLK